MASATSTIRKKGKIKKVPLGDPIVHELARWVEKSVSSVLIRSASLERRDAYLSTSGRETERVRKGEGRNRKLEGKVKS